MSRFPDQLHGGLEASPGDSWLFSVKGCAPDLGGMITTNFPGEPHDELWTAALDDDGYADGIDALVQCSAGGGEAGCPLHPSRRDSAS